MEKTKFVSEQLRMHQFFCLVISQGCLCCLALHCSHSKSPMQEKATAQARAMGNETCIVPNAAPRRSKHLSWKHSFTCTIYFLRQVSDLRKISNQVIIIMHPCTSLVGSGLVGRDSLQTSWHDRDHLGQASGLFIPLPPESWDDYSGCENTFDVADLGAGGGGSVWYLVLV